MASPLNTDLKSVTPLQTYLNIALKKFLETDKYQILKVTNQESSRIDLTTEEYDRFTIVYNILDTTIKLMFLFDNNNPLAPPDIILEDNIGFDKQCEKLNVIDINQYLSQWNVKDEYCIQNLVNNLINAFKEYNFNRTIQFDVPKLNFEINTLMNVCENYKIMILPHTITLYEKIRIIIPVEKKAKSSTISVDDVNDYIYGVLLVCDYVIDISKKEVVSTSMDYVFSKKTKNVKRINKKLPKWDSNSHLFEYIEDVETSLDNTIVLKKSDNSRKEFLSAIISAFNEYLLEYDSFDYSYAAFYIKHPLDASDLQANSVVLYFYLTDDFPHHEPVVTIIIPYHQRNPEYNIRHDIKYHFSKKFFVDPPARYQEAAALFKNYVITNIPQFIREYKN